MEDYQARGYIFESIVWKLLQRFGYIDVKTSELRGRGASHQIDAYGVLAIPTAFMYPVRLICECKCYGDKYPVQLQHMRSFLGVIKDISENYIVDVYGNRNSPNRYTDVGCFFSAGSFTIDAQEYAWAHNLFIIPFANIPILKPVIQDIREYVNNIKGELRTMTKATLINRYWEEKQNQNENRTDNNETFLAIGIIDMIFSLKIWSTLNEKNDKIRTREWKNYEENKIHRGTNRLRFEAS